MTTSATAISRRQATGLLLGALAAGVAAPALAVAPAGPSGPTRGFNLLGWVDRLEGTAPSAAVLDALRVEGFETIRLPVDPDLIATSDATARRDAVDRVHEAISACVEAGFAVILDAHPNGTLGAAFGSDLTGASDRAIAAWVGLRNVVAGFGTSEVFPELLNEPSMAPKVWGALRDRLAETVRASCPDHTLIWGPARVQGIWELDDTPALPDRNSIVAVHYYTPMGFTHQCENWDDTPLTRIAHLPWPTTRTSAEVTALAQQFTDAGDVAAVDFLDGEFGGPWTAKHIAKDFADLGKWARGHGTTAIVNEFGVLNFCVDASSRGNWVRAVRQAAEANGIGWTYWELDQGFGFIKDRRDAATFDASMIDALLAA